MTTITIAGTDYTDMAAVSAAHGYEPTSQERAEAVYFDLDKADVQRTHPALNARETNLVYNSAVFTARDYLGEIYGDEGGGIHAVLTG